MQRCFTRSPVQPPLFSILLRCWYTLPNFGRFTMWRSKRRGNYQHPGCLFIEVSLDNCMKSYLSPGFTTQTQASKSQTKKWIKAKDLQRLSNALLLRYMMARERARRQNDMILSLTSLTSFLSFCTMFQRLLSCKQQKPFLLCRQLQYTDCQSNRHVNKGNKPGLWKRSRWKEALLIQPGICVHIVLVQNNRKRWSLFLLLRYRSSGHTDNEFTHFSNLLTHGKLKSHCEKTTNDRASRGGKILCGLGP